MTRSIPRKAMAFAGSSRFTLVARMLFNSLSLIIGMGLVVAKKTRNRKPRTSLWYHLICMYHTHRGSVICMLSLVLEKHGKVKRLMPLRYGIYRGRKRRKFKRHGKTSSLLMRNVVADAYSYDLPEFLSV